MYTYILAAMIGAGTLILSPVNTQAQDTQTLSLSVGNRWIYDLRQGNTDVFAEERQPVLAHTRKHKSCVLEIIGDTTIDGQSAAVVELKDVPNSSTGHPFRGNHIYLADLDSAFVQYAIYNCREPEFSAMWLWSADLAAGQQPALPESVPYCSQNLEPHLRNIGAGANEWDILAEERTVQHWTYNIFVGEGGSVDHFVFTPGIGILEFGTSYGWRNSMPNGFLATLRGAVIDGQVFGDTSRTVDPPPKVPAVDSADLACLLQFGNRWVFNHSIGPVRSGHRVNYPKLSSNARTGMTSLEVVGDTVFNISVRDTVIGSIEAAIIEARNLPHHDGQTLQNRHMYWTVIGNDLIELRDFCDMESPSRTYLWNDSLAREHRSRPSYASRCPNTGGSALGSPPSNKLLSVILFDEDITSQAWTRLMKLDGSGNSESETYAFSPIYGPLVQVVYTTRAVEFGTRSGGGSYALLQGADVCGVVYGDTTITSVDAGDRLLVADGISLAPSPFQSDLHLSFEKLQAGEVVLRLFDLQGRLVGRRTERVFAEHIHTVNWHLGHLEAGAYLLMVESAGRTLYRGQIMKSP